MRNYKSKGFDSFLTIALLLLLQGCAGPTFYVAPYSNLEVIDPVWTTSYVTRNHGYLVYDTLFSMNEMFEPEPQMVDTWSMSTDKKTWTLNLREGLKWHDGTNVTAEDCIVSLGRWGKRDGEGQFFFKNIRSILAVDADTIEINLYAADQNVPNLLAKMSSNVPFMMPKHIAQTDPFTAIQDPIGSGPYIFKKDEWVPGKQAVYVRNEQYVPRNEPVSLAAGGKVAHFERIIWRFYKDRTTAANALLSGEVDYMESPPTNLIPLLEKEKEIVLAFTDPLGNVAMARFNTLIPPFNNVDIRRAVLMAMDQKDYMTAALGDQKYWKKCFSVFPCGTEFENQTGNEVMKVADIATAKAALKKANYDGTPVVLLNPTDAPVISAFTKVTEDKLRQIGMNVVVQDMTWAALTERRAKRVSGDGSWNMFHTWWIAADLMSPEAIAFSGDSEKGWFGWPADKELEQYRSDFRQAVSKEEADVISKKIQSRLFEIGAFGLLGQFFEPVAYHNKVKGVTSPVHFFGNMSFNKAK